ncbi:glycosyltransferase [Catalinimonas niigatensis]|uniref:glycosyltransferase n=1 Tax=Catalinimonas niigatensis TaxID=1397264 RepID=UPI0026663737|nr:glycosyltransferase [Catalinimonas niigatensis]WPP52895.1 glycosyltransferase [Catalinimonas niigatensis]
MKILRVIASMNPSSGGPCQGIRNSIPALNKLGIQTEVVSLDDSDADFLGDDPFVIHAVGSGKNLWSYSKKLIPWLAQNMTRFDVIVVHGLWQYHSYAVRKTIRRLFHHSAKQRGSKFPKVFIMPHGMLDPYFQKAPGRKLKAIRNWLYWKLIEGKVVNEANGLLFTCEGELTLARQPFRPYSPNKEFNVGYGISSPPPFTITMNEKFREKCPNLMGQPYFLFLSRIHEKKGIEILLQAYAKLRVRESVIGNEAEVLPHLIVAGPGMETTYGKKIQQLVTEDSILRENVYFSGMLSGDAKWGAFYGCEAFILPSHQENFGIAVVEALACSKPVLISNQVNIWREIKTEGSGLVADDNLKGTQALLEGWLQLTNEEKTTMRRNAKMTYKKNFAIEPAAQRLLNAISTE